MKQAADPITKKLAGENLKKKKLIQTPLITFSLQIAHAHTELPSQFVSSFFKNIQPHRWPLSIIRLRQKKRTNKNTRNP